MDWRPKNWENPHRGLESETFIEQVANTWLGNAYEAGANAMLKALQEEGSYLNGDTIIPASGGFPEIHCPGGMTGWLVLIPDES